MKYGVSKMASRVGGKPFFAEHSFLVKKKNSRRLEIFQLAGVIG